MLVKSSEFSLENTRKSPPPRRLRVCVSAPTVWATEISVTLTGISVAQTLRPLCDFRPPPHLSASICAAAGVHVLGGKIHVVGRVCNFYGASMRSCLTNSLPSFFIIKYSCCVMSPSALWCVSL